MNDRAVADEPVAGEPGMGVSITPRHWLGLALAPPVYAWFQWGWAPAGATADMRSVAALTGVMAVLWIFESVPLAATALLPLVLLPLWGVATPAQAASSYANDLIFLFIGGFILANGIEHWGLHRRLARRILALVGSRQRRLVGAIMAVTAFISLWISNTAAALLMMPVALGLLRVSAGPADARFGASLVLGVSAAATIGGMGTPIGSTPNILFVSNVRQLYAVGVTFPQWMAVGIPLVILFTGFAWWLFVFMLFPVGTTSVEGGTDEVVSGPGESERWRSGEVWVAVVFVAAAIGWIFREPISIGGVSFGLSRLWPGISDGTIAIAAALALFCVPVSLRPGRFAVSWEVGGRIPWGIILLFGGGLALADAIKRSGLDALMVHHLAAPGRMPGWAALALICAGAVLLSEIASNTATAALLLPLVGPLATGLGEHALFLMLPVALATSLGLMLPVATPPNALALGTGHVTVRQMMLAGLILNVVGLILIIALSYLLGFPMLGVNPGSPGPP